jgi:hypothetical protein
VVVAVIFLDATFLFRHSEGSFWPRIADPQRDFCHKNWWKTLLYVNNYSERDELLRKTKDFNDSETTNPFPLVLVRSTLLVSGGKLSTSRHAIGADVVDFQISKKVLDLSLVVSFVLARIGDLRRKFRWSCYFRP